MGFLARAVLALSLATPLPALAQDSDAASPETISNGQVIGAWTVNCVALAVGETSCNLTQRILRSSDGAFVADVIAARDPEAKTFLIARVPIGVSLTGGFVMREEDSEDLMTFDWQVCSPELCEALLQVEDDQIPTLSADENVMIAAFRPTPQSEPFVFQLSLNGMQAGLDALEN